MSIQSFECKKTKQIFEEKFVKGFDIHIQKKALDKLRMLDAAVNLDDLKKPPGNKLKSLEGDRKGQYSIRVNKQFRICFVWKEDGVHEVEFNKHYE